MLFTEGTEISLKVKYLMGTQTLVLCFCYNFSSEFVSGTYHRRTRTYLGYCIVTRAHFKAHVILLPLFIKFPHLKCHLRPNFKLIAKAPCCYCTFLYYLINTTRPLPYIKDDSHSDRSFLQDLLLHKLERIT